MSVEQLQNKTEVNKTQVEDGQQNISSCQTFNNKDYMKLCKGNAADSIQNTTVLNNVDDLGMEFKKVLRIFYIHLIYIYLI